MGRQYLSEKALLPLKVHPLHLNDNSLAMKRFLIRIYRGLLNLLAMNHSLTYAEPPPPPPPSPASPIRRHKRITEYFSVMAPYLRRASIWLKRNPLENRNSCFNFLLSQEELLSVLLFSSKFHCECRPFSFRKNMLSF